MNAATVDLSVSAASGRGLHRGTLGGRGCTLADAFQSLERSCDPRRTSRHNRRNLFGARIPIDPREGVGHWEFTRIGSGLYVVVENFAYKQRRIELVPGDGLIQFYFKLSGDLTMGINGTQPLRMNRPSLLIYQQPQGVDFEEWTAANAEERSVAISVDRSYLAEEFFASGGELPTALEAFVNDQASDIQYRQVPLNVQMFDLAKRLIENTQNGSLGLVYTEAVALELLCLAISSLQIGTDGQPCSEHSDHNLRGLYAARSVLMKQLASPPTIPQVARMAGINESSLKRGFKAFFGETIFDFSVRCRMEHAFTLLRERRMPISQVAEAVGYSHQTSFATAFRRHFGIRPKDARPTKWIPQTVESPKARSMAEVSRVAPMRTFN